MPTNNNNKQGSIACEEVFSSFIRRSLTRLRKQPHLLLPGLIGYLRGIYYKFKFIIFFKKIHIGKHFRVYGRLIITGPGSVTFGDDCIISSNVIKTVKIKTQQPDSKIIIGNHVGLNGTSFVCLDQIYIDDYAHIADAYISDSPTKSLSIDRRLYAPSDIPAERVYVGKNVWISVRVVILQGVTIGDNSVIAACSLVRNNVPPNVLVAGIPAKIIQELPESFSPENK